jgi:outer membrane receptor protein involved in Fe transport
MKMVALLAAVAIGLASTSLAAAEDLAEEVTEDEAASDDGIEISPIEVVTWRPLTAASQRTVRDRDFLLLPRQTASDLLLNVPHLHLSQHSGGGKGHQIFLRGFDAEHGEDLAVYLDGVPLNLPSHIHGVGYTDLHFLIPEAVARIELIKGPYDVRYGDFAVAGAINFELRRGFKQWRSATTYGSFNTLSQRMDLSTTAANGLYVAGSAELFRTEGFTSYGGWGGGKFLARLGKKWGRTEVYANLGAYASEWDSADTVPAAAVQANEMGFYGGVDDSDGGRSHRFHASIHVDDRSADRKLRFLAYVVNSGTLLYSNYTYFLRSIDHGDQAEQGDRRLYFGTRTDGSWTLRSGTADITLKGGAEYRGDLPRMEQWRTEERNRWDLSTRFDGSIHSLGSYASAEVRFAEWFSAVAGARYDHFFFNLAGVEDLSRPSGYVDQEVPLSGTASAGILSPKGALIFSPLEQWDIFFNYGRGFHSPDIRDMVRNADAQIPDAHVGELSTRLRLGRRFDVAVSIWLAYVEDELFFDPDLGRSIGRGESRRMGEEVEIRWAPWRRLMVYADLGYTDARLLEDDSPVVGSPRWMATVGACLHDFKGFHANARMRHIGARPLDKARMSEAATVVDLLAGWEQKWVAIDVVVENLLDSCWKDAQFYYVSRHRPDIESPQAGYHFTPGTPLAVRGVLTLKW